MPHDLIILGCGPHAREMADIVTLVNHTTPTWRLKGFLAPANEANRRGELLDGFPVLGTFHDSDRYPDALFVPEYNRCPPGLPYDRLATLIAPNTFIASTARIGRGCVIYPFCYVGLNAVIGDCAFILSGCVINHDDYLEDHVTLTSGVTLAGSVHVESGCYLGQSCTVRQLLRIGRNSLIGMGSVVVKDVPPYSVMVGNPARRMRDREAVS